MSIKKKILAGSKTQHSHHENHHAHQHETEVYLEWTAPGRPFKKHSREYFINLSLIMIAIVIILFLFSQYLLILVVVSLVFLAVALAIVPPRPFSYRITNGGILVEDHFYIWNELYDFYFIQHYGEEVLHIRTKAFFPGELTVTLGEVPPEQVKAAIFPHLPFREYIKPTFMDKAGNWLEQNFPLEKPNQ